MEKLKVVQEMWLSKAIVIKFECGCTLLISSSNTEWRKCMKHQDAKAEDVVIIR